MSNDHILSKQFISPELKARARAMRSNMTPAESKLWYHLRRNNLANFHFRRQQIIGSYIVDFYCHSTNLVVELNGSGHLDQAAYDKKRDETLAGFGLSVLRFYNSDVIEDIDSVLEVILAYCQMDNKK